MKCPPKRASRLKDDAWVGWMVPKGKEKIMTIPYEEFLSTLTEMFGLYNLHGREALVCKTNIPAVVPLEHPLSTGKKLLPIVEKHGIIVYIYDVMYAPEKNRWEFMFHMDIGSKHMIVPYNFGTITSEHDRFQAACAELVLWYKDTERCFGFPCRYKPNADPELDNTEVEVTTTTPRFYMEMPSISYIAEAAYPSVEAFVKKETYL